MKAGRELDALVAEKVMGLVVREKKIGLFYQKPNDPTTWPVLPDYSTDIAASWQVVEKLRKELCCFILNSDHNYVWECYGIKDGDDPDHEEKAIVKWKIYARADTAPLAICLAAMKTVSEKVTA